MSTHTNENDPAFPQTPFINQNNEIVVGGNYGFPTGLTAREHAAIHLRVPMSGNPWLDAMITEARRWDAAQASLVGSFNARGPKENVAHESRQQAHALTRQMKGGAE